LYYSAVSLNLNRRRSKNEIVLILRLASPRCRNGLEKDKVALAKEQQHCSVWNTLHLLLLRSAPDRYGAQQHSIGMEGGGSSAVLEWEQR
jgi:hypothetical protein